jgi:hypothetical protein
LAGVAAPLRAAARIRSAAFSAIMMVAAALFARPAALELVALP